MPALLILFCLANLVISTGAFIVSPILGPISESLGVSVPAAGQAMTAYALSTAVLAPLLLVATGRWRRKNALLLGLGLFTAGNLVCALAPNLSILLAGRVLMGLGAVFTPVAAGITVALVDPARRGTALALVFLGISLSYVIGIPIGTWLGLRFGWQVPIAAATAASALLFVLVAWRVPRDIEAPGARFAGLGRLLAQPPIFWTLTMTLFYFTAIFCVFAYIGPVLQALQPMSGEALAVTLALFGLSGAIGTLIGGWAHDHYGVQRTLRVQLAMLASMMALLPLMQGRHAPMVGVLLVWGVAGFGMMAPQQSRLAHQAPAQAPLLLSINTSMLYFGSALGAAVGGAASGVLGFDKLAWVGVPFAVAGMFALHLGARRAASSHTTEHGVG
jgi:MFS transporter, DHA1 family, inner membrane transport protein